MFRFAPISVVETPRFLAATRKPQDGGVRKLRWAFGGRGIRGGARVVYFYRGVGMPLFALAAFAKNERSDLSQQDRNDFRQLTAQQVAAYKRKIP